jgi:hypothetical protein
MMIRRTGVLFGAVLLAVALMPPTTAFGKVDLNIKEPVAGLVFEDICGLDLTHTDGNLHIVLSATENKNRMSGGFHFQPQGAKLVDEFGRVYSGTGVGQGRFNEPVDGNGAMTFTIVDSFKLIGHGAAPSLLVQGVVHMTINANGDVTTEFEKLGEQCK